MPFAGWRQFALAAAGWIVSAAQAASAVDAPRAPTVDEARLTADARAVVRWVLDSGDNQGRPFAIVDKKGAQLAVLSPGGRVLGATAALLGEAAGDHTVPGVGDKPPSQVQPQERTTPAGRFLSEPGRNLAGEHVVWVDYDAGFAIHRLRPGAGEAARQQRLASPTPDDNRASLGCVVVDRDFYTGVVMPALGRQAGVVYVLPETRPLGSLVGGDQRVVLQQGTHAAAGTR